MNIKPFESLNESKPMNAKRTEADERMWNNFNMMQKKVMSDKTTKREFFAQSEADRTDFYNWMKKQCGGFSCYL